MTVLRYDEVVPCDVIVLTGGTGFSPRDCTPEAVQPLFTKNVPGIQTALISESLKKTKHAMLSRYLFVLLNFLNIFTKYYLVH